MSVNTSWKELVKNMVDAPKYLPPGEYTGQMETRDGVPGMVIDGVWRPVTDKYFTPDVPARSAPTGVDWKGDPRWGAHPKPLLRAARCLAGTFHYWKINDDEYSRQLIRVIMEHEGVVLSVNLKVMIDALGTAPPDTQAKFPSFPKGTAVLRGQTITTPLYQHQLRSHFYGFMSRMNGWKANEIVREPSVVDMENHVMGIPIATAAPLVVSFDPGKPAGVAVSKLETLFRVGMSKHDRELLPLYETFGREAALKRVCKITAELLRLPGKIPYEDQNPMTREILSYIADELESL